MVAFRIQVYVHYHNMAPNFKVHSFRGLAIALSNISWKQLSLSHGSVEEETCELKFWRFEGNS